MNSQNLLKTIEYPSELDMRIAELEKELAPFLENPSFTVGKVFTNTKSELLNIIGVSSGPTAKDVINQYLGKYNEYIELLKEKNDFLRGNTNNIAYNYELKISRLETIKTNLENSELNLRKKNTGLEKEIIELQSKLTIAETTTSELELGLRDITSNLLNSAEKAKEKVKEKIDSLNQQISELKADLREAKLLSKRIEAENIEDLYERIRSLESADSQNKHFQEVIADLQINKENLTRENEKLKVQLLEKIAEIFSRLASFNKDSDIGDTINILDGMLKDSNTENLKLQINLSEKDKRIQELERQLNEANKVNKLQTEQLTRIDSIVDLAKQSGKSSVGINEIGESLKTNSGLGVHPGYAANRYIEIDNHHQKTQAAGLAKYTQQDK